MRDHRFNAAMLALGALSVQGFPIAADAKVSIGELPPDPRPAAECARRKNKAEKKRERKARTRARITHGNS